MYGYQTAQYLVILTVGTFVMVESVFNNTFQYKSVYNTSCGFKFDILTADSESTCKTDPGNI